MFGSDEYPEFSNSNFIDIAAVLVNGQNQALFNNNPNQPLGVINENLESGNFIDNTAGAYNIEYDGVSSVLSIRAKLNPGTNTIKIAIADTGDQSYDSGLYVTDFALSSDGGAGGGVLLVLESDDPVVLPTEANELISLKGEGSQTITGNLASLNGDVIEGFSEDDAIKIKDKDIDQNDIKTETGSLIINIDSNGDGVFDQSDSKITLAGDFEGKDIKVTNAPDGSGSILTLVDSSNEVEEDLTILGTNKDETISGKGGNDTLNGSAGNDILNGNNGNDWLKGGAGVDTLNGGQGDDKLEGGQGNDTLDGGTGNDILFGGAGNDVLIRVTGNDILYDERGSDTLTGGSGADEFKIYADQVEFGDMNTFTDFSFSEGDTLVLRKLTAADGTTASPVTINSIAQLTAADNAYDDFSVEMGNNGHFRLIFATGGMFDI